MGRKINRLNARSVLMTVKNDRHADGSGLYLSISPNGGRRWVFLFRLHCKLTEIGLVRRDVSLARARELAGQARAKLAESINFSRACRSLVEVLRRRRLLVAALSWLGLRVGLFGTWRNADSHRWERTVFRGIGGARRAVHLLERCPGRPS
jgi:hypothetical protein